MRLLLAAMLSLAAPTVAVYGEEARMPDSIQQVRERHAARLMSMPGVVSVGIGRDATGEPVIVVGLQGEGVKAQEELPRELEGYPVRTQIVGEIKTHRSPG